ncbi:hypothetical protein SUGI_0088930 [Cryptomeria japonica]|uniref:fanconi-associated nuclease 1 homolog isoform X2 n=1 Tax=Cryptomeria japonica TaxID=3369 RepID=UPI002408E0B3|nr:fanconi-associated nuclease 1 homolog isoform X2 [Cryptomeria japonica]GLJ08447.1 hypothetical protein SUGI_0088930 [Cryptomeria japonica]
MLRGRESLIRMVGKRRRIESHDLILSQTNAQVASGQTDTDSNTENTACVKDDFVNIKMASFPHGNLNGDVEGDYMSSVCNTDDKDWVLCPVCGKSIQGRHIIINEHLDICLRRGSKRKLTQRTLLQFNVGLNSKEKSGADKDIKKQNMDKKLVSDAIDAAMLSPISKTVSNVKKETVSLNGSTRKCDSKISPNMKYITSKTSMSVDLDKTMEMRMAVEDFSSKILMETSSILSEEDIGYRDMLLDNQTEVYDLAGFKAAKRAVESIKTLGESSKVHESWTMNYNCDRASAYNGLDTMLSTLNEEDGAYASKDSLSGPRFSLLEKTDMIASSSDAQDGMRNEHMNLENFTNNLFLGMLDTFIVGRKFNRESKVEQGASISVMRDLQNPKDKNAIKVTYQGSECGPALGHLPRELALHLSLLLDNGSLEVQGTITSIPDNSFAPVPIKLFCQKIQTSDQEDFQKEKLLKSSWMKVVHTVKLLNSFPSDTPKYQRNFKIMIQTVLQHHSYLLIDDEKSLLESFQSLSGDAQRLFIRLYQRKGPWFRISTISYSDIADSKSACEELIVAGYFSSSESEMESFQDVIKEMFAVLSLPELRQLVSVGLLKTKSEVGSAKKDELLQQLFSAANQKREKYLMGASGGAPSLYNLFAEVAGCCIKISDLAGFILWRVQRLFFLNGEQDLSAFLLVDMGLKKYPDYSCNQNQCIFSNRADLLSYEQALAVAQIMDMALDANDMPKVTKCIGISSTYLDKQKMDKNLQTGFHSIFLAHFSAAWVHTKILTLGVSVLEHERRYEEAVELLKSLLSRNCCPGQRGYWTLRLSVDLEHMGQIEESLAVAEKGIGDTWVRAGDQMALQRCILRLGKPPRRWKKPSFAKAVGRKIKEVFVRGRPLNSVIGAKSIFYGYDGQQCSVEELALQYYAGEQGGSWQGVHSEGSIWTTYFGLLMWDVLFSAVPDVFWTPFQTAPLDLRTDSFYPSRESLIEKQLSKIQMGKADEILASSWEAYYGTSCQGVNWERFSLTDLQTIASCIGGPGLAAVCKLLAEDYGSWSSGMPDLLLWRTFSDKEDLPCMECFHLLSHGESSEPWSCCCQDTAKKLGIVGSRGEAKLVEVKGPRDQLSEQQRAWILVLMDAGLSTEVCKITELPKETE